MTTQLNLTIPSAEVIEALAVQLFIEGEFDLHELAAVTLAQREDLFRHAGHLVQVEYREQAFRHLQHVFPVVVHQVITTCARGLDALDMAGMVEAATQPAGSPGQLLAIDGAIGWARAAQHLREMSPGAV